MATKVFSFNIILYIISGAFCDEELNWSSSKSENDNSAVSNSSSSGFSEIPEEVSIVHIKVFYESLCPGSAMFLTEHLQPVVQRLPDHVDVTLVPYGFASTYLKNHHYYFECQHGPVECYGNKLHSCVLRGLHHDKNQAALFNSCLMKNTISLGWRARKNDFVTAFNWCTHTLRTYIPGTWRCMNNEVGSRELKVHGDVTKRLSPPYVPYVFIGTALKMDQYTVGNLMLDVCQRLHPAPDACIGYA